jgi:transcriptional regulator with XRE-family HTH domain
MSESQLLIHLGRKIKESRTSKKMTQDELAGICGFEKARISRMENGHVNPTILSLYKICKALGIEIKELFTD